MIDRNDDAPMMPDAAGEGRRYWRSLEELANDAAFQEALRNEFPRGAAEMSSPFTRRSFLGLMAASAALAGSLTGCRRPEVAALPYTKAPERLLPGVPEHYATSIERAGEPIGVIVTCHEGRPIKIEGNPEHPASLGAVDPITQSLILELYDPDRSQAVLKNNAASSLDEFSKFAESHFKILKSNQGDGLAFLYERTTSPAQQAMMERMRKAFPKATWHEWEPVNDDNAVAGAQMVFPDRPMLSRPDFEHADVILAIDCDFLGAGPHRVANARAFAERRRPDSSFHGMNRLYVVESAMTLTGAAADHRYTLSPSQYPLLMQALFDRMAVNPPSNAGLPSGVDSRFLEALAADLKKSSPYIACLVGAHLPPAIHAAAMQLNAFNPGGTIFSDASAQLPENNLKSIIKLVELVDQGRVSTLVMIGGNPAYDAPANLEFAKRLKQVKTSLHLSLYANETTRLCSWHVPRAHALESWGDARSADGTVSLIQPLLAPLYGGLTPLEFLALLAGEQQRRAYDIVRAHYQSILPKDFDAAWRKGLHDGVLATQKPKRELNPHQNPGVKILNALQIEAKQASAAPRTDFELILLPHPYLHDGRYANNAWLQETPEPITKLSWDNAALLSPAAAAGLKVSNEDVVEIKTAEGRAVELPAWIVPGMDDHTVAVHLGYGRTSAGRVGNGRGVDVQPLITTAYLRGARGVKLTPTGRRMALATMQVFGQTGGRPLVREVNVSKPGSAAHAGAHPTTGHDKPHASGAEGHESHAEAQLWDHPFDPEHPEQWAMAIDLSRCIGCHSCVLACQAENNVPVVGKAQIAKGRIMQWLRVDRYFSGSAERPDGVVFQPMPCQQCETAPCEQVCPVAATTHSPEGLNDMAYNRCVGTRYCSNNCPFKVRRFNFFNYRKGMTPIEKMAMNPDVTVRMRGVMEKCTYCVQRIIRARVAAKAEGRPVHDGEVMAACQQACPTGAIIFGNQADPNSRIARFKRDERNYTLLDDINLRPRTSYLARLRNLNPALIASSASSDIPHSAFRIPHSQEGQS